MAANLPYDVGTLRKAKRKGAPGFRGSRVYPAELLPWLKQNAGASDAKEKAELRMFLADAEYKELRTEQKKRELLSVKVFVEAIDDLVNEQRTILRQKLENEYPAVVAGLEPAQARVYGKRVVDELFRLMQQLAGRFRAKLNRPQPDQEREQHPDRPQPHGGRLKTGG
jgi:hypothetical protein